MALFADTPSVGLLLTDELIYAVEVAPGRNGEFRVLGHHQAATPTNAYVGGAVTDAELLARALRELWNEAGFTSKKVVLGLPSALCAWRRMDIPPVSREEQGMMIRNELQAEGLFDPALHILDFLPLALPPGEEGVPVTVATAEEFRIHAVDETLEQAGLKLEAVEPLAVSAVRLAALALEPGEVATVALVADGIADLMIAEGGTVRFQRRISGEWLPTPARRLTFLGTEEMSVGETATLEENAQGLLGEIRRSVVFCQRLAPDLAAPERVLLLADHAELGDFITAASTVPSPMDTCALDGLLLPRLDPGAASNISGPGASCFLLALGLALRRIPMLADGNRMDLSQSDSSLQLQRSAPEIRLRAATVAGVWLFVNAGLALGLWSVAASHERSLGAWKEAAAAASADDPRLLQRDRVEAARKLAEPEEVSPDRWLDLLGAISSPEIQVTSLQLTKGEVTLSALVGDAEVVLPFTSSLEKYLPFQGNPSVSVSGETDGKTSFNLTAKLSGPVRLPRKEEEAEPALKSDYQAQVTIEEVPGAAAR